MQPLNGYNGQNDFLSSNQTRSITTEINSTVVIKLRVTLCHLDYVEQCHNGYMLCLQTLHIDNSQVIVLSGDVSLNPGPAAEMMLDGEDADSPMMTMPKNLPRGMLIGHLNVRSLVKNFDEGKLLVESNSFDVLGLSETFLNENICDGEVKIPGYTLVRDR